MWQDVAIQITSGEVEILRRSEDEFTEFAKKIVEEREIQTIKQRRIESKIKHLSVDEIEYNQ